MAEDTIDCHFGIHDQLSLSTHDTLSFSQLAAAVVGSACASNLGSTKDLHMPQALHTEALLQDVDAPAA